MANSVTGGNESRADFAWLLVRCAAGAIALPHAWPKLFGTFAPVLAEKVLTPLGLPAPLLIAYGLGVLELVGGVLLILGLGTRVVALLMVGEWAVITFAVAIPKGWIYSVAGGGAEFPAIMTVLYLAIVIYGAGRLSLDRWFGTDMWPSRRKSN
jgi:putative oxidoreductase